MLSCPPGPREGPVGSDFALEGSRGSHWCHSAAPAVGSPESSVETSRCSSAPGKRLRGNKASSTLVILGRTDRRGVLLCPPPILTLPAGALPGPTVGHFLLRELAGFPLSGPIVPLFSVMELPTPHGGGGGSW